MSKLGSQENYWGGTDMVFQCLIDQERTAAFKKAIKNSVKKGDVVIDLGSGTGILAMFAIEAGAKRVYVVEIDEYLQRQLELNLSVNGFRDKIFILKNDARKIELPEKVDVVICEMIATGLIDELQVPVMNNILKFCKKNVKIIPQAMESFVEVVFANDEFYGHKMSTVQYEYNWHQSNNISFTDKVRYHKVDFSQKNTDSLNKLITVTIKKTGTINGIRITNRTFFPDKSTFDKSAAYCMPLILPLRRQKVKSGQKLLLKLNYKLCGGLQNIKYSVMPLPIELLRESSLFTKKINRNRDIARVGN